MKTTKNEDEGWVLVAWRGPTGSFLKGNEVAAVSLSRWRDYEARPDPRGWVKIAEGTRKEMETFEKLTKEPSDEE